MQYLNFTTLSSRNLRDLTQITERYHNFYKYTKADILNYLKAPDRNEENLREASIYLYNACSYYKRLILYFAMMPTLAYIMAPSKFDPQKTNNNFQKSYLKNLHLLENMQIADTFRAPLITALREDISYNYIWETKDSFMLQPLDPKYCKLSTISDGCYNVAFDFQYFRTNNKDLPLYSDELVWRVEV